MTAELIAFSKEFFEKFFTEYFAYFNAKKCTMQIIFASFEKGGMPVIPEVQEYFLEKVNEYLPLDCQKTGLSRP